MTPFFLLRKTSKLGINISLIEANATLTGVKRWFKQLSMMEIGANTVFLLYK